MRNWSKEEVVDVLREAHEALVAAEVPDDLREQAFNAAVQLVSAKTVRQSVPVLAPAPPGMSS